MAEGAATFRVSADAYDRFVGRYGPELAAALLREACIEPGMRVLDVGCGPAALARALAGVVGAANVSGVDPSEPFAAAARERVPDADIRVGTAESLPFPDDVFDAALAQLVVNFMSEPERGIREMVRVTKPGGVVGACVWDYAPGGEMTLIRSFWNAAIETDPTGEAHDEGVTMRFCREGELGELFSEAGLREVRAGALVVGADYDDFDDLVSPFAHGVGPVGAYYVSLDEAARERLLDALRRRLGSPEGPFRLSARAWYAVGRA